MCPRCLSLSSCCSLFIPSLSAFVRVYVLDLAEALLALCLLFGLCMVLGRAFVSSMSALVRLSLGLCIRFGCAFACSSFGHLCSLQAVLWSALKLRCAFAPCLLFPPFVRLFCICIVCLGFVCVYPSPGFYIELGRAVSLRSAALRPNQLSLDPWWCRLHALLAFSMTSVFCLWKGQVQMQFRASRLFEIYAGVNSLFCPDALARGAQCPPPQLPTPSSFIYFCSYLSKLHLSIWLCLSIFCFGLILENYQTAVTFPKFTKMLHNPSDRVSTAKVCRQSMARSSVLTWASKSQSVHLTYLSIHPSIYLRGSLSIYLTLSVYLSFYPPTSLSIHLSIYLCTVTMYLSSYLSIYLSFFLSFIFYSVR